MKIRYLIILFFISLSSLAPTHASTVDIASCYSWSTQLSSDTITQDSKLFVQTLAYNINATQGQNALVIRNLNSRFKYIPFSTNITQSSKSEYYANRYGFENIDSDQNREIILETETQLPANSFVLNANFSTRSYTPTYFISEDGINYSQVSKHDIGDFSVQKIKIVFEPISDKNIREIIQIGELSLLKLANSYEISGLNSKSSDTIKLYTGNTCSQISNSIEDSENTEKNISFVRAEFKNNSVYEQNNTDSDGDGVSDAQDNCKNIANPDQTDKNQNGIGDVCEFDTDQDGVFDEIDNCRNTPNPLQEDADNDGIGDACDNCKLYNPDQRDENNDGLGDICELQQNYIQENDSDKDGIINQIDNCENTYNPLQEDSDKDGVGDACDNCINTQNPDQLDLDKNGVGDICEDSDGDGIEGLRDNCINTPNPDQKDSDNDGVGDVCEDDDYDAVIFSQDNCPYVYNPDQKDTDKDGIGDACDDNDNRVIESSRVVFIILLLLLITVFCAGIYMVARKIQK